MIDFSEDVVDIMPDSQSEGLWVNKYRPTKLSDMCLDDKFKALFQSQIDKGDIQNMTLVGPPGTGKTTLALVLAREIKAETLFIPCASGDGRVDTIDAKIVPFCQYSSPRRKVIILDDLDSASSTQANSFQKALRNVIETYSDCRFIATANYPENIINPILSRLLVCKLTFNLQSMFKRIATIFKSENIDTSNVDPATLKDSLGKLIHLNYPDIRSIIGKLQIACTGGLTEEKLHALTKNETIGTDDFFKKVVSVIMKEGHPFAIRKEVNQLIVDAIASGDENLAEFISGYAFAKGLFTYIANKDILKIDGMTEAMIDICTQLNVIENCVDKEIQVFKLLLLIKKALK